MTLETQQPDLKQEQLEQGKAALWADALKHAQNIENGTTNKMSDVAKKLLSSDVERKILLIVPSLSTSDLRMNVSDKKENIENKSDLLPESTFTIALNKYIPRPPKISEGQLKKTWLDKAVVQKTLNDVVSLQDSAESNYTTVKTLQDKILDNKETWTSYYPKEKPCSHDWWFWPYTWLALLTFLWADASLKDTYKEEVTRKINDHKKSLDPKAEDFKFVA